MNDQDRITQLEAECAAMRAVLQACDNYLAGASQPTNRAIIKQALSSDAGKSLLDRLQKAETRLAEWETLRTNDAATHQNILRGIIALTRPQALHLAGAQDYDELKDRLQAVEKERDGMRTTFAKLIERMKRCRLDTASIPMVWAGEDYDRIFSDAEKALQPAQKDSPEKGTK